MYTTNTSYQAHRGNAQQPHPGSAPYVRNKIRGVAPDVLGIIAFSDEARPVLPLVSVIAPETLSAPLQLNANGNTNTTAALRMANKWLSRLPKHIVRRVTLISDGEPNRETDSLNQTVSMMRANYITIDSIYCGTSPTGAEVLRNISASTVGGHFHTATSFQALSDLVTSAAARLHRRQGATVILVDTSTSMEESMPGGGGTRIGAAIKACQSVALVKRVAFNRVGGLA